MRTSDLDYRLPEELIAARPVEPRDRSRMLVLRRSEPTVEHHVVADLPRLLRADDAVVFNTAAVTPARLTGRRDPSGGRVEGLFLDEPAPGRWRVMLRSNGRLRPGDVVVLDGPDGGPGRHRLRLVEREEDAWTARLEPPEAAAEVLAAFGRTPIPPYILRARGDEPLPDDLDRGWYQTVYADAARRRSVAAPTAGLHFTPRLLDQLAGRGLERIDVMLDVGHGTFKPIAADRVEDHPMHAETFRVEPRALAALRRRADGSRGRIIAIGTTSVRTLESLPSPIPDPAAGAYEGITRLLIAPPWTFRLVDGLLTNFHLPRSTLLALVAALVGVERLLEVYREAVAQRYRFYSYGDAMLILP